jgi:enoyl-[acyl-carrier protein] reductase I
MGLFEGKKGLIFGIANDRSIAWAITQQLHAEGAEMGFTHLPDSDPARPKAEKRLRKLVDPIGAKLVLPCDAQKDEDLDAVFAETKKTFGKLDFVLHSMAYAPIDELKGRVTDVSREGFRLSMDVSAYTLIAIANRAEKLMTGGGSILAMTYLGGETVIPGYNLMGICKATLDSAMTYLAHELGPKNIRVNALSAGPLRTLAASAVGEFDQMQKLYETFSPLRRNVTHEEVGGTGMFLLSDKCSAVTGEVFHVDGGYHIMGAPPHDIQEASA